MKDENLIPEFKNKELNLQYSSDLFEDDSRLKFRCLWSAMEDYKVNLTLNQILALMLYRKNAEYYAFGLMSVLKDEEFREGLSNELLKFRESFVPESRSEKLIFNIFREVCDEIYWIDDVLKMEEYNFRNGDD